MADGNHCCLPFATEAEVVGDAGGELLLVVRDHDHRLVRASAEGFDDGLDKRSMTEVEAVEGLVEDEQFGVLDKGSG